MSSSQQFQPSTVQVQVTAQRSLAPLTHTHRRGGEKGSERKNEEIVLAANQTFDGKSMMLTGEVRTA